MSASEISDSLRRLESWIEAEGFRGWDPFDALNSPLLRRATLGSRWLGVAWVQLFKRSPVNLRPLFGVPKGRNPKGMGLFLASYLRRSWTAGEPAATERAEEMAEWLRVHTSPGYSGACWGYNFPWPNRAFFAEAGTPTVVNTAFIARALLESGDVGTARSACDFVLRDLNRVRASDDELCFSYTPNDHQCIYNASLLGAELLAVVHAATGEPALAGPARSAANFVVRRQREDGAWSYGADRAKHGWVDNFHTGFVLMSLDAIRRSLDTTDFDAALESGYGFWKRELFDEAGVPKYYAERLWPIDIHAVAQAILTFLAFADRDPEGLASARRTAVWAIRHMQDESGYFHYQVHRRYRIRIPYMRWGQAWMQRALRELVWHEAGRPVEGGAARGEWVERGPPRGGSA